MSDQPQKPAYTCNGESVTADRFYAIACDPARSVAIEACAGAGKTWMLVSRMLRALLSGARPESILAITYTRKAAGEMRKRLQQWLYAFAHEENDEKLAAELIARGIEEKQAYALLPKARGLYTELLSLPREVEIRTFHGWFAQLLGAAPLGVLDELGLPVNYELVENDAEFFEAAWQKLLQMCLQNPLLKADLEELIQQQGLFNAREAIKAGWSRRIEFMLADERGVVDTSLPDAVDPTVQIMQPEFEARWLVYARALGQEKQKTPLDAAVALEQAFTIGDAQERFSALRQALFPKAKDTLKSNLQKFDPAQRAAMELENLLPLAKQHQAYLYQQRMTRLTRAFLAAYTHVKRDQGVIDMSDLERFALRLLGDTQTYGWVAERLDSRITQVLIDEFQDTNPLQWQALRGWLSAYGGIGAGTGLSVFIVGDPKQSIYRFRRADPAVFNEACRFLQQTLAGDWLACDHTRRNVPEVIACVNDVFGDASQHQAFSGFRRHTTSSSTHGMVARLPYIERQLKEKKAKSLPQWRDSLEQPRFTEESVLREMEVLQVADLIEHWLVQDGWSLSDIKVLSRKKERLRELLVELNRRQLAWRFTDDIELSETQEAQDIIALMDVLASPSHDLSLAQVLRSPIFGLDDECLITLAEYAKQSASASPENIDDAGQTIASYPVKQTMTGWDALMSMLKNANPHPGVKAMEEGENPQVVEQLRHAARLLDKWEKLSKLLPPHDLLDAIYADADVETRYLQAVPAAMRDGVLSNLRALLKQTLSLDGGRYATPYNFVRALRRQGGKNEHPQGGEAIELLTIHGAKGLEARGIIVLDTDPAPSRTERLSVLMDWPADKEAPEQFIFYESQKALPEHAQVLAQKEAKAQAREELNALYVAMTRARERLVFSALQPHTYSESNSWWNRLGAYADVLQLVQEDFTSQAQVQTLKPADEKIRFLQLPEYTVQKASETGQGELVDLALFSEQDKEYGIGRAAIPAQGDDAQAQRFGMAVHRLLEWGSTENQHLQAVAQELALTAQQTQDVLQTVQRILQHPQSRIYFNSPKIQMAFNELELWYQGKALRIDRLVKIDDCWWVLDYKSAWSPLAHHNEVYHEQLRLYREALLHIYPGSTVRTVIIAGTGEVTEIDHPS